MLPQLLSRLVRLYHIPVSQTHRDMVGPLTLRVVSDSRARELMRAKA